MHLDVLHLTGSISSCPRDKIIFVSRQALIQEIDFLPVTRMLKGQGIEDTYSGLEGISGGLLLSA
jgi:hypothetical protein